MTFAQLLQKGIPMKCLAVLRQQTVNQKEETHPVKTDLNWANIVQNGQKWSAYDKITHE